MNSTETKRMEEVVGKIYSRETFGTVDGPGVRYVFFLQGCPLRCLYCHNPDSRAFSGGEAWTAKAIVEEVKRYKNYIINGGVTFSGGEPLAQSEFLVASLTLLKEAGFHTTLDTSGCYSLKEDNVRKAIDLTDLVLLDIKSIDPIVSKNLAGATSDPAFELLDYCQSINKPVWIRQVLLRGYTLNKVQLTTLADKLKTYSCIERIELLPFHKLGEPKWENFDLEYSLKDVDATNKQELEWAQEIFANRGLSIHSD